MLEASTGKGGGGDPRFGFSHRPEIKDVCAVGSGDHPVTHRSGDRGLSLDGMLSQCRVSDSRPKS